MEVIQAFGVRKGDVYFVSLVGKDNVSLIDETKEKSIDIPRSEFDNYFKAAPKPKKRLEWSEWKQYNGRSCIDCQCANLCKIIGGYRECPRGILYRTNGKTVQVKHGKYKAKASCYPGDKFNLSKGLGIALIRLECKAVPELLTMMAADRIEKIIRG